VEEIWKDIEGYEGLYQVSNFGRVKSLNRIIDKYHHVKERILKHQIDRKGYHTLMLSKDNKQKRYEIHRLFGLTFISQECECFNHKDGNKDDNSVSNLDAATFSENINHAVDILKNHGRALCVTIEDKEGKKFEFGSMSKAEKFLNKSSHWLKWRRNKYGNKFVYEDFKIEIKGKSS